MILEAIADQIDAAHKQGGISAAELPVVGYVVDEIVPGLVLSRPLDDSVAIVTMGGIENGEDRREMWLIVKDSKPLAKPIRVFEAVVK